MVLTEEEANKIQEIVSNQEALILSYSNEVYTKDILITAQSNQSAFLKDSIKKTKIKTGFIWFMRGIGAAVISKAVYDFYK